MNEMGRFLSPAECQQWCKDNSVDSNDLALGSDPEAQFCWVHPPHSVESVMEFYRSLAECFEVSGLIWLREWPMSRDYQIAIIKRLRASFGERSELIDVPGQFIE